jgi:uncharacterized repeat protein (TIGR01451 family)
VITVTMRSSGPVYNVLPGTLVTLTTNRGTLNPPTVVPMISGQNLVVLTSGTIAGRSYITGTTPCFGTDSTWVDFLAGPAAMMTIVATPPEIWITACGAPAPHATGVVVTATDEYGNPCVGAAVTYTLSPGTDSSLSWVTGILDAAGSHSTVLNAGTQAGVVLVTATVGSVSRSVAVPVMSGPPWENSTLADPHAIPADGVSVSTITAGIDDCLNNPIVDGTMVGFVTNHGSLPYGFIEAESVPPIDRSGTWTSVANAAASGGQVLQSSTPGNWLRWRFRGSAVSVLYRLGVGLGSFEVYVDDVLVRMISTAAGGTQWNRETVAANDLDPYAVHTARVEVFSGTVYIDAIRSGTTTVGGVAAAPLTSQAISTTAYITTTAVDSRLEAWAVSERPTGTTQVLFQRANLAIQKTVNITTVPSGGIVVYTLVYTNTGQAQGTNTLITDTLPVSMTYLSSVSYPDIGDPTNPVTNVWVWNAGGVATNTVGVLEITTQRMCVPGLGTFSNAARIGSLTIETPPSSALNNNSSSVPVTFTPGEPFTVSLRADPPSLPTDSSTTIHITVTDGCGVPVPSTTVYLTTTTGGFNPPATLTYTTRTTNVNGKATATFYGGPACGTAVIVASAGYAYSDPLFVTVQSGPPAHNNVAADPGLIPADGMSTSIISSQILDEGVCPVPDGFFVGFASNAGSIPYSYAEDTALMALQVPPGSWTMWPDGGASGGSYMATGADNAAVSWEFNGNGVSVVYLKTPGAGTADVSVDGVAVGEINMHSITTTVYLAEKVFTWAGSPTEHHIARVARRPGSGALIYLDALRSGVQVAGGMGKALALLTSATTPMIATVTATGISETLGTPRLVPGSVYVRFEGTDLGITKAVQPVGQVVIGKKITFTLTYQNTGPVTATNVTLDDVLSVDALRDPFFSTPPITVTPYTHYYWTLGAVPPGFTGVITFGGRIDTSHYWPSETVLTNDVVASTTTYDGNAGNNVASVMTTIVPERPASLLLTAAPGVIPVGGSISTLTARARDIYGNPVPNGTPVTFTTTLGGFPVLTQFFGSTSSGDAVASLASGPTVGTAFVTAAANLLSSSTTVQFVPMPAFTITVTADPSIIFVAGETSFIEALVVDQHGNWVADGTPVTFATSHGTILPAAATTLNGRASAVLTSGTVAVTATVTVTSPPATGTGKVRFRALTPSVTMTARPMEPIVGTTCWITLTARDIYGNPASFEPVTFTTTMGDFNGLTTTFSSSDALGRAWVGLRSEIVGPSLVRGQIRDQSGAIVVIWQPGEPYTITLSVDPSTIIGCGGTGLARAVVRDRYLNLVRDGTVVVFEAAPQGDVRPMDGGRTTGGVAQAIVSAGNIPGPSTIWAWPENWRSQVSAKYPVFFEVGPPDDLTLSADPATILVGGTTSNIRMKVVDCGGYPVTDTTAVTFTITSGEGTLSPHYTHTTNGWAYARLTSPAEVGSATIKGQAGEREATLVVQYLPGPPCDIRLTAVPAAIAADGVSTSTVCVEVKDCYGNFVADRTSAVFTTNLGRFDTGPSIVTQTYGGRACVILRSSPTFGQALIAATVPNGRRAEMYVDFFFAPTPTPSPTPTRARWEIRLPIIRKNSRW